jgi:hypothetical protein
MRGCQLRERRCCGHTSQRAGESREELLKLSLCCALAGLWCVALEVEPARVFVPWLSAVEPSRSDRQYLH